MLLSLFTLRTWVFSFACLFFFFNDPATTAIYTLSLHDALPISPALSPQPGRAACRRERRHPYARGDRKSTRLNSSHVAISYAVFCLKKKKKVQSRHDHTVVAPPPVEVRARTTIEPTRDKHQDST